MFPMLKIESITGITRDTKQGTLDELEKRSRATAKALAAEPDPDFIINSKLDGKSKDEA